MSSVTDVIAGRTERIRSLTSRVHQLENTLHDLGHSDLDEELPEVSNLSVRGSVRQAGKDDGSEAVDKGEGTTQQSLQSSWRLMTDLESQASHSARPRSTPSSTTPSGTSQVGISAVQREALNKVLSALDEFGKSPSLQDWSTASRKPWDDEELGDYDLTASEIINIFATPDTPLSGLNWSNTKFASYPSTELLGKTLLEGKIQDDQKTLLYKIILNFQAGMILAHREKHLRHKYTVKGHIEHIRAQKFRDVLSKLDQITFRTPPSLHLLRAQCIGVVILQYFGNLPEAWSMMAAASRTFISLGYDRIIYTKKIATTSDFTQEDVDGCVVWCYQLDRSLSLLLRRQPLLPRMSTSPQLRVVGSGLPEGVGYPRRAFIPMNIHFAHIQGEIAFLMDTSKNAVQWKDLESLRVKMKAFWEKFCEWQAEAPNSVREQLRRDIRYLEFKYHATETLLLQLPSELATSSQLRKQAVEFARKTFQRFEYMVRDWDKIEMMDLGWDLMLYCLSPLCVLTYDIINTRDDEDLMLVSHYGKFICDRIYATSTNNPLAKRISDLFMVVLGICDTLNASASTGATETTAAQAYPTNHTPRRKNFMNFETFFGTNGAATDSSSNAHGTNLSENGGGGSTMDATGARAGNVENPKESEEQFLKLLTYKVKLGWSGESLVYARSLW
ncbi:conserved hypothetical protein [Talaromyces stipitatus ATCC 10500]|uniref:Transcription factor domain-containing protein n=1 Tax=Talaromyces stipitatus (strain ATCC 10500 / CBS 375.48 / QM 6759 / NRRL 1006) TaxID=441959 RepID=B8M041_TALSN|nr:uncharacterized protein TSTA_083700 [Talaromyces stipitatus ATCC 10500]EED21138.1 conserved hypothetical protein [Talaromyces stipitatus ATCC 10500]